MRSVWNICLTHDPAYAGLYRAVSDFSRALDAPVLSFDDRRRDRAVLSERDRAHRIASGSGPFCRDSHVMSRAALHEAETLLKDADLLIVHSMFRAHATWAAGWATRHGKSYWAVPHGCLDPWGLSQRRLAKRLWLEAHGRGYFANADRIVFSTKRELDKAAAWLPTDRAAVVHWPVPLPAVHARAAARATFRRRLGLAEDCPILLFVGRLHTMKRPVATIHAFCEAAPPGAHLVVAGMDGDLTRRQLIAVTPIAWRNRVHVVGPLVRPDLAEALLGSDGFVSLSYRENFGYAAAEAVSYGLPVILSPGHDLAYEMPTGCDRKLACGWLLPEDSLTAAVQAVREWGQLAVHPSGRQRLAAMATAGRDWAAETLAFDTFKAKLEALAAAV